MAVILAVATGRQSRVRSLRALTRAIPATPATSRSPWTAKCDALRRIRLHKTLFNRPTAVRRAASGDCGRRGVRVRQSAVRARKLRGRGSVLRRVTDVRVRSKQIRSVLTGPTRSGLAFEGR